MDANSDVNGTPVAISSSAMDERDVFSGTPGAVAATPATPATPAIMRDASATATSRPDVKTTTNSEAPRGRELTLEGGRVVLQRKLMV